MSTLSLTNVVSGNSIMASDVNNGWTAIKAVVNGDLDETNFAPGLIYSPGKIKQDGAAANDVLYWTGSAWDNIGPRNLALAVNTPIAFARTAGTISITNTVTETDLMTTSVTGPLMSTDKMLRLTLIGDITMSNLVTGTLTFRMKFGGNTLWGDAITLSNTFNSTQYPWMAEFWLVNVGSASVQVLFGRFNWIAGTQAGSVAGFGSEVPTSGKIASSAADVYTVGENPAAALDVNTASSQTLALSAQFSVAATAYTLRRHFWMLEML